MRRPALTQRRIEGLVILADRARGVVSERGNKLWALPTAQRRAARDAIKFIDEVSKWNKTRGS